MCSVRFTLTSDSRKAVERHLKTAQQQGRLRQVKYYLAILAVGDGKSFAEVALVLRIHEKTVATWVGGTQAHRPPPQADPDAESRTRHPH